MVAAVALSASAAPTAFVSAGAVDARQNGASTAVDPDRLDRFVADQMDRVGIPGVAYAVVGRDGVQHQATFGEDGDGRPVLDTTPFLWGSVAKPVAASLIVTMASAGELDLDARVTKYLPEFTMADDEAREITLRHLLSQTSGIPERMDFTDRYAADRLHGDVLTELADAQLVAGVGEEHVYSSINYMVLGAVVEEVTGRPYDEVLRERILKPAGMDTAIADAGAAADRLPSGNRYVLGRAWSFGSGFDPAGVSSGYLGGSLRDAVAFARAHLPGSTVLTETQRSALFAPEVSTGEDRGYGLGWRTWPVPGSDQPMVWHSGAAPGYQASVVVLPEQERAVVVLQNVYGSFQENQLLDTSWGLASLLSGTEPQPHDVEPLYVGLLAALGALCLSLATGVVVALWRLVRPRETTSRRRRTVMAGAGWLVGLAVVGGGLLLLPRSFGVGLGQVSLWAPDVAGLLTVGLVLVVVLASCRVAVTVRSLRRLRRR